jgi:hypothetical protein
MRAIQCLLALGGHSGANDPDEIFFPLRVDNDDDAAIDRADGDEAILELRMFGVEDLEEVGSGLEEPPGLPERQTVLSLVPEVLRFVPLEVREVQCKPLAD